MDSWTSAIPTSTVMKLGVLHAVAALSLTMAGGCDFGADSEKNNPPGTPQSIQPAVKAYAVKQNLYEGGVAPNRIESVQCKTFAQTFARLR